MNAAIIGMGPHGKRLFRAISKIKELNLLAIIDRDEKILALPDFAHVPLRCTSLAEIWGGPDQLDVLLISTNGPSHAPIALEALDHGVSHILISKPIACRLEDALKIKRKKEEKGARVIVDYAMRYTAIYNWISNKIKAGDWGEVKSIYIQREGIGLGCLGVHSFDLANMLMDDTPKKITGWVDEPIKKNPRGAQFIDPGGLVILDYGIGKKAIVSQIEDGNGPRFIEINCQFARLHIDEKFGNLELVEKDRDHIPGPGNPTPLHKTDNPQGEKIRHDLIHLMELIIRELISGGPMKADIDFGINSLEVLIAAYASNQNGNIPIALPLTKEEELKMFLSIT